MFDLGWTELLFIGALALIVIGPRELPGLFRAGGRMVSRIRRLYGDLAGSISRLEQEVDSASGRSEVPRWQELVPEDIRHLPADFTPGSLDADQHRARREAYDEARRSAGPDQPRQDGQQDP